MPLRSPTLATTITICLMTLTLLCQLALAARTSNDQVHPPAGAPGNDTQQHLVCTPFGKCEPCPEDSLDEPFCQPFGNRRLMHCQNSTSSSAPPSDKTSQQQGSVTGHPLDDPHPEGETLAWGPCGRIVSQERADFYEFVACNVLFAVISLVILFARSRRLQARQARQLAARIGLIRGGGGRGGGGGGGTR